MSDERAPIICAEFEYEGHEFQVVAWPETESEAFDWDVVRADMPYVWRRRQTFSPEFGSGT